MQPPLHRTHHDETRISQTLHQMIGAHTGQEHIGFPRKAAPAGYTQSQDFRDLVVGQFFMGCQEEHCTSLQWAERNENTDSAHEDVQ